MISFSIIFSSKASKFSILSSSTQCNHRIMPSATALNCLSKEWLLLSVEYRVSMLVSLRNFLYASIILCYGTTIILRLCFWIILIFSIVYCVCILHLDYMQYRPASYRFELLSCNATSCKKVNINSQSTCFSSSRSYIHFYTFLLKLTCCV